MEVSPKVNYSEGGGRDLIPVLTRSRDIFQKGIGGKEAAYEG